MKMKMRIKEASKILEQFKTKIPESETEICEALIIGANALNRFQQIRDSGHIPVDFYIDGRLFRAYEIPQ